jgi:hypothetical protein
VSVRTTLIDFVLVRLRAVQGVGDGDGGVGGKQQAAVAGVRSSEEVAAAGARMRGAQRSQK